MVVVGRVAIDDSGEVAEFMEDGCEEVVASIGGRVRDGAEEGFCLEGLEFEAFPGCRIDKPAEAVGVIVNGKVSCNGVSIIVRSG